MNPKDMSSLNAMLTGSEGEQMVSQIQIDQILHHVKNLNQNTETQQQEIDTKCQEFSDIDESENAG